ncbi:DJ-1/PfpI family protein [Butyrivibrio sp. INlla21]|uniref:DJ-1/PfpI family protein n=1 Tax=Butyrivibrio sp. INlla21 TaxID=1520811 RepID=UPI0008E8046F|nr:DJ-1/PfpI family protein [Butyrivibrio sp. INlla21]SFU43819.1 4-methyl-5(b-hydroxyethyl)-thiazole monophosphate biosynthesis [Butyrivibrio sp. INlla21]
MNILLFCCKGFENMEFAPFVDVMGWARNDHGYDVNVTTCGFTKVVNSTFDIKINMDKTIDEIDVSNFDALAIPGGFTEWDFYDEAYDEKFLELIREFDRQGKIIASICVGALPIGKSGVLKGRNATTYHLRGGYKQKELAEFGVNVIPDQRVVVDKNIITSFCPETAADVAFTLLEKLVGKEKTAVVSEAMGY